MTAEWVAAIATALTAAVVAASAAAALVQLRHMRNANQVAIMNSIEDKFDRTEFLDALNYTLREFPARCSEANVRRRAVQRPVDSEFERVRTVQNFWEGIGSCVRHGMVDPDLVCDRLSVPIDLSWRALAPLIHNLRVAFEDDALGENFEYLAVLAARWRAQHQRGNYPRSVRRMPSSEIWPETLLESGSPDINGWNERQAPVKGCGRESESH